MGIFDWPIATIKNRALESPKISVLLSSPLDLFYISCKSTKLEGGQGIYGDKLRITLLKIGCKNKTWGNVKQVVSSMK
jgi:hypothetical protein